MYLYSAYGLHIRSELFLPELVPSGDGDDVSILLHDSARSQFFDSIDRPHLQIAEAEATLSIEATATFVIREGKEINIYPVLDVDHRTLRRYIIGPVLALLLSQRGCLVLHASCVKVADKAIAFLGEPGMGKSSMAAAFYSLDYPLISDDVTAVQVDSSNSLIVYPAFPEIKLDLDVTSLIKPYFSLPTPVDKVDGKLGFRVEDSFCNYPVALNRLYVLEKDISTDMERLSPQEAIKELLKNSYPTRWAYPGGREHFLRCAIVTRQVPVYRIRRASSISALKDLAGIVVRSIDNPL